MCIVIQVMAHLHDSCQNMLFLNLMVLDEKLVNRGSVRFPFLNLLASCLPSGITSNSTSPTCEYFSNFAAQLPQFVFMIRILLLLCRWPSWWRNSLWPRNRRSISLCSDRKVLDQWCWDPWTNPSLFLRDRAGNRSTFLNLTAIARRDPFSLQIFLGLYSSRMRKST